MLSLVLLLLLACGDDVGRRGDAGAGLDGFFNDAPSAGLAVNLYNTLEDMVELNCGCLVSEGEFLGTVAECVASAGLTANPTCVQGALDEVGTAGDEEVVRCQLGEASGALSCARASTCGALVDGSAVCDVDLDACGDISAGFEAAIAGCL